MKKKVAAAVCVLVLAAGAGAGWYYYKNYASGSKGASVSGGDEVYMQSIASMLSITGGDSLGISERYIGVVDTQESKSFNLDSDKKLDEIYVEVGQEVKSGDPLFSYDVEEMQRKVQEADLELEEMNNQLQTLQKQLTELQTQAAKAKESEKQAYNLEILSAQNSISKQNYNISVKQIERAQLAKNIDTAIVYSDIDGIVKSINENASSSGTDTSSESTGTFMTIIQSGDYRIKGTCSEMNIYNLYVGEEVIVTPRSDESKMYSGVIEKINSEPSTDSSSSSYYYSSSSETSSKYNFYVVLNEKMDLMLGQHVIIEPDNGQSSSEESDGLWLPYYYLVQNDDGSYYVWSAGDDGLSQKRTVEVGEYDENDMKYEILSGITDENLIAYPDETLTEGMTVIDIDAQ